MPRAGHTFALVAILLGLMHTGCANVDSKAPSTPQVLEIRLGATGFVDLPIPFATLRMTGPSSFELTRLLEDAREDDTVAAILLRPAGAAFSRAARQEIASELRLFRDSGKPVIFFDEAYANRDYVLAAHGDKILTVPTGTVDLLGMASDVMFYAELLDKLGVKVDYVRAGSYKSFVEPYTRNEMSPELESTVNRLLDDLYDQMVEGISAGRGMDADTVRARIDGGPYTARDALDAGLVDALLYEDELDAYLDKLLQKDVELVRAGHGDSADRGFSELVHMWRRALGAGSHSKSTRDKIALVHVEGMIVSGSPGDPFRRGEFITSGAVAHALNTAAEDDTVKAIVVRVDSPGGSALASDVIWRAIDQARKRKPVIVSMGGVAASGGYYVAAGAHHILAEEGTITGSIGVFGAKFDLGGLYEKLGVHKQQVTRGSNATLYDESHGFTASERQRIEAIIGQIYADFLERVADGRSLTLEEVEAVAQGQVWTGREALAHGLVDEIGGLKRAFEIAKERAGYSTDTKFELLDLPTSPSVLDLVLRDGLGAFGAGSDLSSIPREWLFALGSVAKERSFALLPYSIQIR